MDAGDATPPWQRRDPGEELARARVLDAADRAGWLALAAAAAAPCGLFGAWRALAVAAADHTIPALVRWGVMGLAAGGGIFLLGLGGRHIIRAAGWGSVSSAWTGMKWACVGALALATPGLAAIVAAWRASNLRRWALDERIVATFDFAPFLLLSGLFGFAALVAGRRIRSLAQDPAERTVPDAWQCDPSDDFAIGCFVVVIALCANVVYVGFVRVVF